MPGTDGAMTTNREPQDQAPGADPVGPGDVPAERPQSLDRLDALTPMSIPASARATVVARPIPECEAVTMARRG